MDRQCSSCGGFCKKSGCERENVKSEPEPVAQYSDIVSDGLLDPRNDLYTAPQQREWVGLTHEEYEAMAEQCVTNCYFDTLEYAKSIEAKLKEKNT